MANDPARSATHLSKVGARAAAAGPVRLTESGEAGDRFLIYSSAKGIEVRLRYEGDGLWMTQAQMAELFGKNVSVISRHAANILDEGELDEESNLQKVQIAGSAKPVTLYSLDMVISVGYRVNSSTATLFRRWATNKLVQFATKGFVVDVERLKAPDERDHFRQLREIIAKSGPPKPMFVANYGISLPCAATTPPSTNIASRASSQLFRTSCTTR